MPHDPYGDAADPRAAQDAAWREIVENYGDRPLLEDEPGARTDRPHHEGPEDRSDVEVGDEVGDEPHSEESPRLPLHEPQPTPLVRAQPAEEHYVPPPPPPIPSAEPHRLLAWIGLLGVPVLVLLAVVVKIPVPSWLGLMMMAWFVGGFVYLVASMRSGPRDDDDDGAVV